ncbi:MAG TPA: valine--tRNA ligase [Cytophagaceae bacterium]|jgi:valyl-tRNA synthetase|nr:valine--tRNA ligase [Cytophagaceae bacterium]
MSEILKTYNPLEIEEKWYRYWLENKLFSSKPSEKEPYTIVIPPPNVTGVLHMGHMLNNTIQDVLIRRARMQGKEACWVPGTDHASIATEAKVVGMLRERNIKKSDLSREEFLNYAWEWKEKYGGIILEQLKKLGASVDWDRTRFTMEPKLSNAVSEVFVRMYEKEYIYKGLRMVNWDPQGKTALSDEEVIHKEVNSKLYHLKYVIADGENADNTVLTHNNFLTVATTRPETILGDTAICVNPKDERYQFLKGKKVFVPIINRVIPVIMDEYVDMDFGTGCLKVTPAHDVNDYQLGQKYQLEVIDIMNEDGTFNENSGLFAGKDRFVVRKEIVKLLDESGHLSKVEDIKNNIGYSERTDVVIEPRLSKQWFVDMKKFMQNNPKVLEDVLNDEIQLVPAKFKNTYRHWLENIKDWCISRQLWWGQRIPAFYLPGGEYEVALTREEAIRKFNARNIIFREEDIVQDEDVLDTWFSSWLWPISVFDGFENPENDDIKFYYPTNVLVTAPEILFFWVARMIMAGYEFRGQRPFKDVYLTGIVRDKQGRKMSKSLGNSPDPIELMQKYSADGVRFGMLLSSPAGNDLLFDEKYCEQGRNFTNKVWNAFRLIKGWKTSDTSMPEGNKVAIEWMESKLNEAIAEAEEHYQKFKLSDALMTNYKVIWDSFCAWYLEIVKPAFEQPIDKGTFEATLVIFEKLMKLIHPFMPFISEEIWHELRERKVGESICVAEFPHYISVDKKVLLASEIAFETITQVRNLRSSKQLSPKVPLELLIKAIDKSAYQKFSEIICKLANVSQIHFVDTIEGAVSFIVKTDEIIVPLSGQVDVEKERDSLLKELDYLKGFLISVNKKLNNEKFVSSAPPQVLNNERQKKADAESKIKTLEESLAQLI